MRANIPLTFAQREIMAEFYRTERETVLLDKSERMDLWKMAKCGIVPGDMMRLFDSRCPALSHQIRKHESDGGNVQSAVFSECVYAQALANVFALRVFKNCLLDASFLPTSIVRLLDSYCLKARYAYANADGRRMLIQAGGCGGVDSALITVIDLKVFTIEFKEPGAKTSEPDLPKYGEDGRLRVTEAFLSRYPQFGQMLSEQSRLNFFDVMGHNVNEFSYESVNIAVTSNYNTKKFADVVCTESEEAHLVMLPVNHVETWARIEGEIRPAGRNHYSVWTPRALLGYLRDMGATENEGRIAVSADKLKQVSPRGGIGVSRYKINPLFFVHASDCLIEHGIATFRLDSVRQLNPTIAGKMFFEHLRYDDVRNHYMPQLHQARI